MPLKMSGGAKKVPAAAPEPMGVHSGLPSEELAAKSEPKTPPQSEPKKAAGMSFLKRGAAAKQSIVEADAAAEAAKAEMNKLWRFYIGADNAGEDFKITFLDGKLDSDGTLDVVTWKEHTIFLAGRWKNLPCVGHEEPCPMCESGDKAALVGALTVIDHTPYTIKKGDKQGQKIERSKKLYVMKRGTIQQLQKYATKNGGLQGCSFEVSRNGAKSPSVGDTFMFLEKTPLSALKKEYGEMADAADLEEELPYFDRKGLLKMGVQGAAGKTVGNHAAGPQGDPETDVDF